MQYFAPTRNRLHRSYHSGRYESDGVVPNPDRQRQSMFLFSACREFDGEVRSNGMESCFVIFVVFCIYLFQLNKLFAQVPKNFSGRSAVIKAKSMADRVLCNYGVVEYFMKQLAENPRGYRAGKKSFVRDGVFDNSRYDMSNRTPTNIIVDNPYLCFEAFEHITDHLENYFDIWGRPLPNFACDLSFETLPYISSAKKITDPDIDDILDADDFEEESEIDSTPNSEPQYTESQDTALEDGILDETQPLSIPEEFDLESVEIAEGPLQALILIDGPCFCITSIADRKLPGLSSLEPLVASRKKIKSTKTQLLAWCEKLVQLHLGKIVYVVLRYQHFRCTIKSQRPTVKVPHLLPHIKLHIIYSGKMTKSR